MNKKIIAVLLAIAAGVFFYGNMEKPAGYSKENPIVFKIHTGEKPEHPIAIANQYFAKKVMERTNGRIKAETYGNSQLGDDKSVLQSIQMGAVTAGHMPAAIMADVDPAFKAYQLPYIFDSNEHKWKVLRSPVGQATLDLLPKYDLIGLNYYESGSRQLWNTKRPVVNPEDSKGLRIRIAANKIYAAELEAMGANSVIIPYGEVYGALKNGLADGVELELCAVAANSLTDTIKYVTWTEHTEPPVYLVMSKKVFDQLTEKDKEIVRQTARETMEFEIKAMKEYEAKKIEEMKQKGLQVTTIDKKVWKAKLAPVYDQFPELKPYVDKIRSVN